LRPDGLSIQAQRAETRRAKSGGEVLGEEAASSIPTSFRVWRSAVSSPSRVWGGARGRFIGGDTGFGTY